MCGTIVLLFIDKINLDSVSNLKMFIFAFNSVNGCKSRVRSLCACVDLLNAIRLFSIFVDAKFYWNFCNPVNDKNWNGKISCHGSRAMSMWLTWKAATLRGLTKNFLEINKPAEELKTCWKFCPWDEYLYCCIA